MAIDTSTDFALLCVGDMSKTIMFKSFIKIIYVIALEGMKIGKVEVVYRSATFLV